MRPVRKPEHQAVDWWRSIIDGDMDNARMLADLIRERDAEVAEQVRAEVDRIALTLSTMTTQGGAEVERIAEVAATLVGLTWEPGFRDDRGRDHALPPGGGPEDVPRVFTRTRRLVGPWEPVP